MTTTRARLHELVDQLDDDAAAHVLVPNPRPASPGTVPAFVGSFSSGRVDVSQRAEEILRDELGAQHPS